MVVILIKTEAFVKPESEIFNEDCNDDLNIKLIIQAGDAILRDYVDKQTEGQTEEIRAKFMNYFLNYNPLTRKKHNF